MATTADVSCELQRPTPSPNPPPLNPRPGNSSNPVQRTSADASSNAPSDPCDPFKDSHRRGRVWRGSEDRRPLIRGATGPAGRGESLQLLRTWTLPRADCARQREYLYLEFYREFAIPTGKKFPLCSPRHGLSRN
ncbi:unnamed protein product, partial [Iphiclides podalirius]